MMETQKYYIDIVNGEISKSELDTYHYVIHAADSDIKKLREIFNNLHQANLATFVRSHIPFLEYHHDRQNEIYDNGIKEMYSLLYELGDKETKNHIQSMGVLNSDHSDHL
ncbi:hydrolase [Caldifermentibacillus hisashii]|nr:hydrolase [Caldibacillus thermoamylovorans]